MRWGSKLLELQGDKTAIALGDKTKIVPVLDKLLQAVRAGELDAAIEQVNNKRAVSKRR